MPVYDPNHLYYTLKEIGVIPEVALTAAREKSEKENIPFHQVLLDQDLISDENLGKVIADSVSLPFVRLSKIDIPEDLLQIVPEIVAKRQKIIAFGKDREGLKLAVNDPSNKEIQDFISRKTGEKVNLYYATESDIVDAQVLYQKDIQETFDSLFKKQIATAKEAEVKDVPIAKVVDMIIEFAYENKASDIHIEPRTSDSLVRFRIDGVLHDVMTIPKELHGQVVTRIKILAKLRTDEHMSAQGGKMQVDMEQEKLDIRVSVVPIVEGENCVLRLLSSRSRQFSLSDLGINDRELEKIKQGYSKADGMVLSTGPTGSGKTTTIYSILKIVNTRDKNIATIEDPVEYDIEGISQIQVNPKTNLTFADGLRAILRQDPDIIFVGEIRDDDTADIAISSAMTGHLVLSTLHTNDAATTLPRFIEMGIEPFLVASTVNVIIAQRLVRKICDKCKVSTLVTEKDLIDQVPHTIVKKHLKEKDELRVYYGKGCGVCHDTGYSGRIGIFEVLDVSDEIRKLVAVKADSGEITKQAIKEGMVTMIEDGFEKALKGITTIEEVSRVTRE